LRQVTSNRGDRREQDFLKWLSPSLWQVEAQLCALRNQRSQNTLTWVKSVQQLSDWRTCTAELSDKHRILWIQGRPGVGKSTLSAYLVDFIKCLYPTAIVAYFFGKSGRSGLTSAVDIIRTFAYQLSAGSTTFRSALQALKESGFWIDENTGIHLLFEKLLAEPAALTTDLYFVLDGVDECDVSTRDKVGGGRQMDSMLRALTALPNTKIIFTSRPGVDSLESMTLAATFSITVTHNKDDIQTYVTQVVNGSQRLQRQFQRHGINPVEYFLKHANGMFLWVALALQVLSQAESKSLFGDYLKNFSDTSMDHLYSMILDRFDSVKSKWIKEILLWLIAPDQDWTDEEIKAAVEASLGDEHADFSVLLERDCGSILQIINDDRGSRRVELIHETFRSFITDVERCAPDWLVSGPASHGRLLRGCINIMCSGTTHPMQITTYAARSWVPHLLEIDFTANSSRLAVVDIYHLLTSTGISAWIKFG
jgi:NACHT domain